ncbi:Uncharacterised protein [Chromobacterium violaceum]|uniref:Uncharacterized protein n=1 Tax=Chromobacterium violaceum TaxID=536 RepID=A0A447TJK7_CHRVL|nr:Uncharacterised protein [Chromobacterium violaceum]
MLGARGELSAQGDSAPGGWPKAEQCELVLPAGRTLFTDVKLPDAVKQPTPAVIGFALEEAWPTTRRQSLCIGEALPGGRRAVAATEAAGLRARWPCSRAWAACATASCRRSACSRRRRPAVGA